ncbi:MAG: sigma-54 dependent transcriptional regulator [Marinifilaceae bacterium]|jgi:two-component system response regulator HydG|nr:sigma-54 dependent transcriptional regulator [Marinifilaceae bacterium]
MKNENSAKKILIIDDDTTLCLMLKGLLERNSYNVTTAFNANNGFKLISEDSFDLILSDFRLPDFTGLELLQKIKTQFPDLPIIIMTSYADIKTAVKAIKLGASDYITKPLNPDEIILMVSSALSKAKTKKQPKKSKPKFEYVEGFSEKSKQIEQYINLVAPSHLSVIIEGESGTGKEIVARRIHEQSKRSNEKFVAVDCGALSNELAGSELFGHKKGSYTGALDDKIGQFEQANKGTLFLDEIGNLSYEIQVKLLRALQERRIRRIGTNSDIEVDVRILVATNDDLSELVKESKFREDLYHRLNEFKISVAPLRERKEDIMPFANFFLEKSNIEMEKDIVGFSPIAEEKLKNYSWPGNVRELRNVIRRSVLLNLDNTISEATFPSEILNPKVNTDFDMGSNSDLKAANARRERELISSTLAEVNYNKSKAARLLNIDRKTLYNKIKQYEIDLK